MQNNRRAILNIESDSAANPSIRWIFPVRGKQPGYHGFFNQHYALFQQAFPEGFYHVKAVEISYSGDFVG